MCVKSIFLGCLSLSKSELSAWRPNRQILSKCPLQRLMLFVQPTDTALYLRDICFAMCAVLLLLFLGSSWPMCWQLKSVQAHYVKGKVFKPFLSGTLFSSSMPSLPIVKAGAQLCDQPLAARRTSAPGCSTSSTEMMSGCALSSNSLTF